MLPSLGSNERPRKIAEMRNAENNEKMERAYVPEIDEVKDNI